jgi:hypothetical protein
MIRRHWSVELEEVDAAAAKWSSPFAASTSTGSSIALVAATWPMMHAAQRDLWVRGWWLRRCRARCRHAFVVRAGDVGMVTCLAQGDKPPRSGCGEVGVAAVAGISEQRPDRVIWAAGHRVQPSRGVAAHIHPVARVGTVAFVRPRASAHRSRMTRLDSSWAGPSRRRESISSSIAHPTAEPGFDDCAPRHCQALADPAPGPDRPAGGASYSDQCVQSHARSEHCRVQDRLPHPAPHG